MKHDVKETREAISEVADDVVSLAALCLSERACVDSVWQPW